MSEQQPACRSWLIWLNTRGPMLARISQRATIVTTMEEGDVHAFSLDRGFDYLHRRAIDKFINEARLANLLKLLVVLICLAAILQRVLPLAGINWL